MDDETTSEEYEEKANEALDLGDTPKAVALATLSLMATIREATFVIADLVDPVKDDDDDDDDEIEEEIAVEGLDD